MILDSSGIKDSEYFFSLHIIINNYGYVKSPKDIPKTEQYPTIESELEKIGIKIDENPYACHSHNFRLVGCSKLEDINNRILKLYHSPNGSVGSLTEFSDLALETFRRTLITEVSEEKEIEIEDKADKFCKSINGKKDPIEDEDEEPEEVEIQFEEEDKIEPEPEEKQAIEQDNKIIEAFKKFHPNAEFDKKTQYEHSVKFDFKFTTENKCKIHKRAHKSNRNYAIFFPENIRHSINATMTIVQPRYY